MKLELDFEMLFNLQGTSIINLGFECKIGNMHHLFSKVKGKKKII